MNQYKYRNLGIAVIFAALLIVLGIFTFGNRETKTADAYTSMFSAIIRRGLEM